MANESGKNLIELIEDLENFVDETGTPVRFNNRRISLDREILMSMLEALRDRVPQDISRGQQILDSRENIIEDAHIKANKIIEDATLQAQTIVEQAMREASEAVEKEEIVAIAKKRSEEIDAQADDYLRQAEDYAEKVVDKAQKDAMDIKLNALIYTQETIEGLEDFWRNYQDAQKKVYNQVFDALQRDINDISANRSQLESQIDSLKRSM